MAMELFLTIIAVLILFVSDIDRTAALLGASLGIANIEKKQNKIIINKSKYSKKQKKTTLLTIF